MTYKCSILPLRLALQESQVFRVLFIHIEIYFDIQAFVLDFVFTSMSVELD